ncbi:hypothetical protein N9N03_00320 [Chlamydiia bacterium]|nr:hypothetical protein [Chlamydiia bacterium]
MKVNNHNCSHWIDLCQKEALTEMSKAKGTWAKFQVSCKKLFMGIKHVYIRARLSLNKTWSYDTSAKNEIEKRVSVLFSEKQAQRKQDQQARGKVAFPDAALSARKAKKAERIRSQEIKHAQRRLGKSVFAEAASIGREKTLSNLKEQYAIVHKKMEGRRNSWKSQMKKSPKKQNKKVIDEYNDLMAESQRLDAEIKKKSK